MIHPSTQHLEVGLDSEMIHGPGNIFRKKHVIGQSEYAIVATKL